MSLQLPIGLDTTSQQEDGHHKLEVVIKYRGSTGESGIRQFRGGMVTCQQPARARAWVPCVDLHNKFNCWNLVFHVRSCAARSFVSLYVAMFFVIISDPAAEF